MTTLLPIRHHALHKSTIRYSLETYQQHSETIALFWEEQLQLFTLAYHQPYCRLKWQMVSNRSSPLYVADFYAVERYGDFRGRRSRQLQKLGVRGTNATRTSTAIHPLATLLPLTLCHY